MLFFIERDELDIHDIPISTIAGDFLAYIHELETLNIDVASEFILVAATLMRIKARLLIPRKEIDEQGNEIDPRQELAERLLEYKRYKQVLDDMQALEQERSLREQRGYRTTELRSIATQALVDVELESISLYKLLQTFQRLLKQQESRDNRQVHQIVKYSYTIRDQQTYLRKLVGKKGKKSSFISIFRKIENRVHAIVTFLALLELLNLQEVALISGDGINDFYIEAL